MMMEGNLWPFWNIYLFIIRIIINNNFFSFFLCLIGQKNEVGIATENQVGIVRGKQVEIVIEGIAMTGGGIMIVVVEIVIGTMIEITDMIESVIGILIVTGVMIQEITTDRTLGQGIMIVAGLLFLHN